MDVTCAIFIQYGELSPFECPNQVHECPTEGFMIGVQVDRVGIEEPPLILVIPTGLNVGHLHLVADRLHMRRRNTGHGAKYTSHTIFELTTY